MTDLFRNSIVESGMIRAGDVIAHPNNPKFHPPEQRAAVKASFNEAGIVKRIIINKRNGYLVDGHERTWLALEHGEDTLLPVDYVDIADDVHERLLIYLDGTTGMARTDPDILQALIDNQPEWEDQTLQALRDKIAADAGLLNGDTPPAPDAQIDRAAELNEKWQVAAFDLWQIGEHRLLCGDSTNAEDVARLMRDEKAEILFTSPPYADVRDYAGDDLSMEHLKQFIPVFKEYCRFQCVNLGIIRRDHEIVEYWNEYIEAARNCGLKLLSWNVWDKLESGSIGQQSAMFAIQHEWIFVLGIEPKQLNRTIDKSPDSAKRRSYYARDSQGRQITLRRQADGSVKTSTAGIEYSHKQLSTVIVAYAEKSNLRENHPAIMGADVPYVYLEAMTDQSDLVIDPFGGSGTTMVACEQLSRQCRMMEISENYCAVILQRLSDMGLDPERISEPMIEA